MRDSFDKYYTPLVEIKYFNILIDNKPFLIDHQKDKKRMQKLSKSQEIMIMQKKAY